MGSAVADLARRKLAELRGEPSPAARPPRVTPEELASQLPPGVFDALPSDAQRRLVRWAEAAQAGTAAPIRVGPARVSQRVPKSELPFCGAPTAPWSPCPSCGNVKARAGRTCRTCGHHQPPGPPCRARVARDERGRPRKRCLRHGGHGRLNGPTSAAGRARSNQNLRRGREPGPAAQPDEGTGEKTP